MTEKIRPTRDDVLTALTNRGSAPLGLTSIAWDVFHDHQGAWYSGLSARDAVHEPTLRRVLGELVASGHVVTLARNEAGDLFGHRINRPSVTWATREAYEKAVAAKAAKADAEREDELLAAARQAVLLRHAAEVQDTLTRLRNEAQR